MVFTLVTMSTASQKSLLINTESTWCEYGLEPSSMLLPKITLHGRVVLFTIKKQQQPGLAVIKVPLSIG